MNDLEIQIGVALKDRSPLRLDVMRLVDTRLLVQANSGGGKAAVRIESGQVSVSGLHQRIRSVLKPSEQRVFDVLLNAGGKISREQLADALGYHPRTKSLLNALGRLRSLGVIDYHAGDVVGTELMYPQ